jgi:hypothetical protein
LPPEASTRHQTRSFVRRPPRARLPRRQTPSCSSPGAQTVRRSRLPRRRAASTWSRGQPCGTRLFCHLCSACHYEMVRVRTVPKTTSLRTAHLPRGAWTSALTAPPIRSPVAIKAGVAHGSSGLSVRLSVAAGMVPSASTGAPAMHGARQGCWAYASPRRLRWWCSQLRGTSTRSRQQGGPLGRRSPCRQAPPP